MFEVVEPTVVVREPGRTPLHLVVRDVLEIGRECDGLLLDDPQISRRHLQLRAERGRVIVEDLGSTNGSAVDGHSLDGAHVLVRGEVVEFGDCTVELALDARATQIGRERTQGPEAARRLRASSIDMVAAAAAEDHRDYASLDTDAGTLTIVFSDIESSTERAVQLGDAKWVELLGVHNTIFRRALTRHRGTEIKARGDGFMLSFSSGRAAVQCMSEVQRGLEAHAKTNPADAIHIRVGLHTGEVVLGDDGDLFGKHVVLAARIANEAKGGEILISSLVREIVDARGDLQFGEPRVVELKGIAGSHTVHPVLWDPDSYSSM